MTAPTSVHNDILATARAQVLGRGEPLRKEQFLAVLRGPRTTSWMY